MDAKLALASKGINMTTAPKSGWCEQCNEERPSEASFCQNCGTKIRPKVNEPLPRAETETAILPPESIGDSAPRKRVSKTQKLVGASLVAALLIAGGSVAVVSAIQDQREAQLAEAAAAEKKRLEAETLSAAFGSAQVVSFLPSCEKVAELVSADEGKWESAVAAFSGIYDPREASRVLNKVRSAHGTLDDDDVRGYSDGFEEGVIGSIDGLFASSPRDEEAPAAQINRWQSEWLSLSREACPSEFDAFDTTHSSLRSSAAKFSTIITLAGQVPWYPDGYSELRQGIAFKWVDARMIYSRGYQWDIDFLAQSGCESVYAKIDILDSSGRVIGWTNDTLGTVRPGEVGRLTFTKYSGSGTLTARVSEFNCW